MLQAQERSGNWCGFDHEMESLRTESPDKFAQAERRLDEFAMQLGEDIRGKRSIDDGRTFYIPMVFHVVYSPGTRPIPEANVNALIERLNLDFNLQNSNLGIIQDPYKDLATSANIKFVLAERDPQGNPTSGINYIESTKADERTYSGRGEVKYLSYWPSDRYLNIWVVDYIGAGAAEGEVVGYATLPETVAFGATRASEDGIVLKYSTVNLNARTATHEVGHYLGLRHPFQGDFEDEDGCSDGNCKFMGDKICDIPQSSAIQFGCVRGVNSCPDPGIDNITNYMSYNSCQAMFSQDQVIRMRSTLFTYREKLVSWSNLNTVLGVDEPQLVLNDTKVYPNPFTNGLNVEVSVKNDMDACIEIKDLLGRSAYKDCKKKLHPGKNNIFIQADQEQLVDGAIYLLEIRTENATVVKRIQYRQ